MDAASVLREVLARPATLGEGRLLCIDGPSGAGKTTLARGVVDLAPEAGIVQVEAMYDGWGGLARVEDQLATLLQPLSAGQPGHYRRYDWHASRYAETVSVRPRPLLVLEGVGSWSPTYASMVTLLVWVEAPPDVRLARAIARDGAEFEDLLRQWVLDEQTHFARTRAHAHADLTIGSG